MMFLSLVSVLAAVLTLAALLLSDLSDWLLLSLPVLLASLFLLLRNRKHKHRTKKQIVVDGSNVMYWHDNSPKLETLRSVLKLLDEKGYEAGAIFDANAGYLLTGKYTDDGALAKLLGLPEDRVVVVAKGTPADPVILQAARELGAQILTNDRYRDWVDDHPEIRTQGHLVKGGYEGGQFWIHDVAPAPL